MNESPFPFFAPGADPGSSFADLLRRTAAPAPVPPAGPGTGALVPEITHGTTVVAIRYVGGVVLAGDRRATAGFTIASRRIEKVFPADDTSGVAIAGAAGPAVEMVRLFQTQLEHYEKIEGEGLSLEGKANQLALLVRANLPPRCRASSSCRCSPATTSVADAGASSASTSPAGSTRSSTSRPTARAASTRATGSRRSGPRTSAATDASTSRCRALFAAADEDAATGGPDLVRRIFPTVATIDAAGYTSVTDEEIEARAEQQLGGREEGAGL